MLKVLENLIIFKKVDITEENKEVEYLHYYSSTSDSRKLINVMVYEIIQTIRFSDNTFHVVVKMIINYYTVKKNAKVTNRTNDNKRYNTDS